MVEPRFKNVLSAKRGKGNRIRKVFNRKPIHRKQNSFLCAAGLVLCAAAVSAQTTYSLTDIGTLPRKTISHPGGINNQAQITGFTETDADTLLGTLRKKSNGYSGKFSLATNPENITVKSNLGGSATSMVTTR